MKLKLFCTLILSTTVLSSACMAAATATVASEDPFIARAIETSRRLSTQLVTNAPDVTFEVPETAEHRGLGTITLPLRDILAMQDARLNARDIRAAISSQALLALRLDQARTWERTLNAISAVRNIEGTLTGDNVPSGATASDAVGDYARLNHQ